MKPAVCSVQCGQCPFKPTSLPGYLGSYTPQSVFQGAWFNQPFFCHTHATKLGAYDGREDWQDLLARKGKLCLGGLAFANQIMAPTRLDDRYPKEDQLMVIAARESIKNKVVQVMGAREFGSHHDPANTAANMRKLKSSL